MMIELCHRLASAGMDNTVRVWNVEADKLADVITAGHNAPEGCYFKPRVIQTPAVTTRTNPHPPVSRTNQLMS